MAINTFGGEFSFLSNFHPSLITFTVPSLELEDAVAFTVEHAFQACKMQTQDDALLVLAQATPGKAKRLARTLPMREDWNEIRVSIMLWLLRKKFRIPELREKLIATSDQELVEGNTWGDTFWGVDLESGLGENMLGFLLMQVRREIIHEIS